MSRPLDVKALACGHWMQWLVPRTLKRLPAGVVMVAVSMSVRAAFACEGGFEGGCGKAVIKAVNQAVRVAVMGAVRAAVVCEGGCERSCEGGCEGRL